MTCNEVPGLKLPDGAVRIFLNTHGTNDDEVSKELVEFLHYAEKTNEGCGSVKSERVQRIAHQVEKIKGDHEMGVKYMRFWEELEEAKAEAVREAKEEAKREAREEAKREVREEGVRIFINALKDVGVEKDYIISRVSKDYHMAPEQANFMVEKYWE